MPASRSLLPPGPGRRAGPPRIAPASYYPASRGARRVATLSLNGSSAGRPLVCAVRREGGHLPRLCSRSRRELVLHSPRSHAMRRGAPLRSVISALTILQSMYTPPIKGYVFAQGHPFRAVLGGGALFFLCGILMRGREKAPAGCSAHARACLRTLKKESVAVQSMLFYTPVPVWEAGVFFCSNRKKDKTDGILEFGWFRGN